MAGDMFDIAIRKTHGECSIDCTIRTEKRVVVLTGPSGVGKTTILHCIAGLQRPDSGHITIVGRVLLDSAGTTNLPVQARGCGYAFQDNRLFPHMRVSANLAFGMAEGVGPPTFTPPFTLHDIAEMMDLGPLLDRFPRDLSGGEKRRVAIARAILSSPRFLMLDEPLASLDTARAEAVLAMLEQVLQQTQMPVIYVTHNPAELAAFDPHIVTLGQSGLPSRQT